MNILEKPMAIYQSHTLKNKHGLMVTIGNIGAVIQAINLPDGTKLVLGFQDLADYKTQNIAYLGVAIGRVANRIAQGQFSCAGKNYQLEQNEQNNTLHSGSQALHHVIWKIIATTEQRIELRYVSPAGEGGFPGKVTITITYQLTDDNCLHIDYHATTDQITPLDLTNHTYWNLAGAGQTILDQECKFYAAHYLELNEEHLPTGKILSTKNTNFDFRQWRKISAVDHYFILDNHERTLHLAAEFRDQKTNRELKVFTDQPGFQFYTGQHLQDFPQYGGFCVETQHYPNAVNEPDFPSPFITPEKPYRHTTIYQLSF